MTPPSSIPLIKLFLLFLSSPTIATGGAVSCRDTCGSTPVKYPFGTGPGCGSPLFHPYITCAPNTTGGDQLYLTTQSGSYPITSISYTTSTLTIAPPCMSTCTFMQTSPTNFGLDWTTPFQIGSSTFILLSCEPPTSSLTVKSTPICDLSYDHLCAALYSCPSVVSLGLPLFGPTNTCCVYSPANLDDKGELNLRSLKCQAYSSVMSLGDNPTDPTRWEYGVAVKYSYGNLDNSVVSSKCNSCEMSGGICGYGLPGNSFVCVCKGGFNTSLDCSNRSQNPDFIWGSDSAPFSTRGVWSWILAGVVCCLVMTLKGVFV
ncbi:wall-associated receptor kinase-like 20 [Prosopis cineraria]|uniref:wall-associated receptor kinase-like 20 n=1 Tax=Prosopis cineraria TaxID=364024 RepID=UPI0024104443|nr:wall-associated receptor kinase-like 20 [Prosopis cineraria]